MEEKVNWQLHQFEVRGTIDARSDGDAENEFSTKFTSNPIHESLLNCGWTLTTIEAKYTGTILERQGYHSYDVTLIYI